MSGDALKIYFCDICNESIPLRDLEIGSAITIKGKVICHKCNPQGGAARPLAVSSMPAGGGAPGSSFGLSGVVAVLALLLGMAGVALYLFEKSTVEKKFNTLLSDMGSSEQKVSRQVEKGVADAQKEISNSLDKMERRFSDFQRESDKERASATSQLTLLSDRLDLIKESLRQAEALRTRLDAGDAWRAAADQKLSAIKADMEGLLTEIRTVKEATASKAQAAAQPTTAQTSAPNAAEATLPGWDEMLKRLKDPDPGVRWNAVIDLEKTGDPRAIPFLIPLLKDEDVFVRNNTSLTLGDLDAKTAVGELIDTLSDSEQVVRDSAYTALKRITKQTIKFDPFGKKDERERGLSAWREWWAGNKAKFLGAS